MNASADYARLAGYLASDPDNLELLAAAQLQALFQRQPKPIPITVTHLPVAKK